MEKSRTMIRRLLDEMPDEPTATEATAIAVQLARIEGYLSRDMVPALERAVEDSHAPLLARLTVMETTLKEMIAAMENMAVETARRNEALKTIVAAIHVDEESQGTRPAEKSLLKKLVHWVEEGDR